MCFFSRTVSSCSRIGICYVIKHVMRCLIFMLSSSWFLVTYCTRKRIDCDGATTLTDWWVGGAALHNSVSVDIVIIANADLWVSLCTPLSFGLWKFRVAGSWDHPRRWLSAPTPWWWDLQFGLKSCHLPTPYSWLCIFAFFHMCHTSPYTHICTGYKPWLLFFFTFFFPPITIPSLCFICLIHNIIWNSCVS